MRPLMIKSFTRQTMVGLMLLMLVGCALERAGRRVYQPQPVIPPVMPTMPEANPVVYQPEARGDGSLWTPGISGNPFSDDKAFRRGDIVLVKVIQKSSGTKSANLDTKRDSSISAKIKYFLGAEKGLNKVTGYKDPSKGAAAASGGAGAVWDPNSMVDATSSRAYKGEGSSARSDVLQATVSAVVTDVLANGNLTIYGHQTVMLDNEASVLTVQGIIRPSDIDVDNSIDSGRIANANIQFTGSGVITDIQHPGWATRVFDWVWPF